MDSANKLRGILFSAQSIIGVKFMFSPLEQFTFLINSCQDYQFSKVNLYKYILVSSQRNNLELKFKVKIFSPLECDIQTICTLNQESLKQTFSIF